MKTITQIATLFTIILISQLSYADSVATINIEKAVLDTKIAKQRSTKLEKNPEFKRLGQQFEALTTDLEALNKKYQNEGPSLSEEQRFEMRKQLNFIHADQKIVIQKIQAEQQQLTNTLFQELQPKIVEALEVISNRENIEVILSSETVFYAHPATDITRKVTKYLDGGI